MDVFPEKMMEQLNSGESKIIFRLISCIVIIGLVETRKDFSVVLILQEQFCTSEVFKAIQDAVSLILLYRTVASSTFIMSVVQPIYIPSSIRD